MPKSVNGFNGLLDIPTDYQAHHQLPQQLSDNPFLRQLNGIVDLKDFGTNGIALPRDVTTGLTTGQTPHLGSHPAYTDFINGLLDTATSNYDPSVPLTATQLDELGGRVNAIQAYSRMGLAGLLPDSNVTPGGRIPLNSRDPMITSSDPAEVRAFYNQLNGDLQSKGFTTPESLDQLVDFPRYELLNQTNAFDPNLTAAQRSDLVRNVDDTRASLDASGRTDLTSALDDAARGRFTLNGPTQSGATAGASPDLLQGVEDATGRSFATGLTAPDGLGTIGSSDLTPLQSVPPPDVTTPQIGQPARSPDTAPVVQDNPVVQNNLGAQDSPLVQDNPVVQNNPVVQDNPLVQNNAAVQDNPLVQNNAAVQDNPLVQNNAAVQDNPLVQNNAAVQDNSLVQNNPVVQDNPIVQNDSIVEGNQGSALPDATAPSELSLTPSPARQSTFGPDLTTSAPSTELPSEITGTATGSFTPNFVGVIGQSPLASKIFTGAGVLGTVGLAADAGLTGYNAYQLYNQGDTLGAGHEVAGFGGRLGGSLTGAYLLGEAGAVGGPWGALGGAIVGGIGGAILGDKGVKSLYDSLTGYQPPNTSAAQPTPAWPDQFAAQFDKANGGGPFTDPMTGFQTESQAGYDARRQAFVDSQMADQQTQAQQMLDTMKLMPGFDPTNTLSTDPTTSPLTTAPAAPTTAPAAPTQPPAADAAPDAPANTGTSTAPLNVDPSVTPGNLGGITTPTLDLSQPPVTASPPLSLNTNLGPSTTPDTGSALDVNSAATIGLNSGSDTSFNSGLTGGLNTGINSGLDTGFNSGLNTGLNSGLNTGLNLGLDSGLNSGLNSGLSSGLDSSFNSGLTSGLNSGLDSSLNSGLNTGLNSGVDSSSSLGLGSSFSSGLDSSSSGGLDTGLGSSSSFSDFGDSSIGSDSFGGGSFGGDAGGGDLGPVVLDLSGQGIRITGLGASHATFDADSDGVPNRIAWTTPDEGLLVYDANGSGSVDQTSELALRQWTPGAQTDLQGLRSFDTNHDGKLDAGDKNFGSFDVWQDANGNGITEPGELHSLVDAGVSSISLASDGVQSHLPDGSTIYGQGSFTRTNGTSGRLADVSLAYAPDINAARDQLVSAMAVGLGGSAAGTTAPMSSPVAAIAPMLGIDIVSPLHARS